MRAALPFPSECPVWEVQNTLNKFRKRGFDSLFGNAEVEGGWVGWIPIVGGLVLYEGFGFPLQLLPFLLDGTFSARQES